MRMIEACNMLLSEGICNALKLGIMREVLIRAKKDSVNCNLIHALFQYSDFLRPHSIKLCYSLSQWASAA